MKITVETSDVVSQSLKIIELEFNQNLIIKNGNSTLEISKANFRSELYSKNHEEIIRYLKFLQNYFSIECTAEFQLLISLLEFVKYFDILEESFKVIISSFIAVSGKIKSLLEKKTIVLIPSKLTSSFEEETIKELLNNNQLCKVTLDVDEEVVVRYFVPYNTPYNISNLSDKALLASKKIQYFINHERMI